MTERPILFNAPMVRALLAGSKTQTRRAVKFPLKDVYFGCELAGSEIGQEEAHQLCPYGKPGDRLWVRESWHSVRQQDSLPPRDLETVSTIWHSCDLKPEDDNFFIGKRRPGIFMPRWASRITLEITNVRVERLQDISEADARAEGAPPSHPSIDAVSREFGYADFPRSWYAQLWEQINGAGSWDANPWVWAVSFKVIKP